MNKLNSILIIEDDEITSYLNKMIIEECNAAFQIYTVSDGGEALKLIKEKNFIPDLIFLDIKMAGLDGFDFLEEYQKIDLSKASRIIILTSSIDKRDKIRADNYPILDYLIKPLEAESLKKALQEIECLNL